MTDSSRHRRGTPANDAVTRAIKIARRDWVETQAPVRGGAYSLLHLIVGLADANGRFHVDGTALAGLLKVSSRAVFNRIQKLISAGVIEKTGEKRWVHSIYQLTLPPEAELAEAGPETLSAGGDVASEQSGRFGAHKTPNNSYDQTTSHEVGKHSDWNKNRKEPSAFRSSASQLKPLQPHEGAHLPTEFRNRFIAHFGSAKARSWLFPCGWNDEQRTLLVASRQAMDWFKRDGRYFCNDNDITVSLKEAARG